MPQKQNPLEGNLTIDNPNQFKELIISALENLSPLIPQFLIPSHKEELSKRTDLKNNEVTNNTFSNIIQIADLNRTMNTLIHNIIKEKDISKKKVLADSLNQILKDIAPLRKEINTALQYELIPDPEKIIALDFELQNIQHRLIELTPTEAKKLASKFYMDIVFFLEENHHATTDSMNFIITKIKKMLPTLTSAITKKEIQKKLNSVFIITEENVTIH